MAEVNTGDGGGGHGKHDKKRAKKLSTRIDMTPMVDLAFLLLTFFVMTSTFNKAKTMEINFPAEEKDKTKEPPKINNALTFIMSKDNSIYYYYGQFYGPGNKEGKPVTELIKSDFSKDGVHKLLLERNKPTIDQINKLTSDFKNGTIKQDSVYKKQVGLVKADIDALTVLIKADDKAIYKNVIDLIDELIICQVGKYAVVDMMPAEFELVTAAGAK
jgi:biopolymer transport protein ExbD